MVRAWTIGLLVGPVRGYSSAGVEISSSGIGIFKVYATHGVERIRSAYTETSFEVENYMEKNLIFLIDISIIDELRTRFAYI